MADDTSFTPVLADPPPRQRGHGRGKPEGPAKKLAREHPGQWVLARVQSGRKRGSGMLDSAGEWRVAMRWLDGSDFGVEGDVTVTYIKFVPEACRG